MFDKLFSLVSHDLAIDLGTANTIVLVLGKGIVIREPTVVAISKKTKDILAIGQDARNMVGKTPQNIVVVRPLKDGVISDYYTSEKLLEHFIDKVHESPQKFPASLFNFYRPRVVLGVPSGITQVEQRAVSDAAKNAGARQAFLLEEPMAASLGAGLPVEDPKGSLIVDIGGGTCEIAVISLGGIVVSKSVKIAGYEIDQKVIEFSRSEYNLLIGERTAEDIKIRIGSVYNPSKDKKSSLRGRDLKTGLPKSVEISSRDLYPAIILPVKQIIEQIKYLIEETPPELVADILKSGITLAGGGSLLKGFDKLLAKETNIAVTTAEDPMTCVVKGCAKALKDGRLLNKVKVGG